MSGLDRDRETLRKLKELGASPDDQTAFALRLLEQRSSLAVVASALDVLAQTPIPSARPALLKRYAHFDADGPHRDSGGSLRVLILKALRQLGRQDDVPLLERAARTYEYSLYDHAEIGVALRAEALTALADVDPELASYHAARLLVDPQTDEMSGEPAATAARILAAQGHLLPLYALAMQGSRFPEVTAEALRGLARLPDSLLPTVTERDWEAEGEAVLAGLYDLLLQHRARATALPFLKEQLLATKGDEVFKYLATLMVADGRDDLFALLEEVIMEELRPRRRAILRDVLAIRRGSARVDAIMRRL